MNREELEKQVLLAASGELSEPDRLALDARLAADPGMAAWRADAHRLAVLARDALPGGEPGPAVIARLHAAAQAQAHGPRVAPLVFPAAWLRGLAYAAALALAVGAWLWRGTEAQPDPIAQMHAIVAITSTDAATPAAIPAESDDEDTRLRALAKELLALEGLALDESAYDFTFSDDAPVEEETAPRASRAPTAGNLACYSSCGALAQSSSMA